MQMTSYMPKNLAERKPWLAGYLKYCTTNKTVECEVNTNVDSKCDHTLYSCKIIMTTYPASMCIGHIDKPLKNSMQY